MRKASIVSRALELAFLCLLLATVSSAADKTRGKDQSTVIIVVGASGEEEFGKDFEQAATLWTAACEKGGAHSFTIGLDKTNTEADLDRLKHLLTAEPKESPNELWLVLLGHGTYNGKEAKFNLRGPDISTSDLADWLKPFKRPLAIVDCSAASSPFINKLSASNRVIITATRSGNEQNYARFGKYLSEAIANPEADLDKDGQTSLLEAFLMASRRAAEFYESDGRLVTEHALLDDNGDGLGTPADWFRGIRAVKQAKDGAALDGLRANQFHLVRSAEDERLTAEQRAKRDELELAVIKLREGKGKLKEDDYYQQLENLMVQLARASASR